MSSPALARTAARVSFNPSTTLQKSAENRFERLAPRALVGARLMAALLLVYAAITLLFGQTIHFLLLAPMGLVQFVVSLRLLARGSADAHGS